MAEASQAIPILLYLLAGLFGAIGQYFYKIGADRLSQISFLQNWPIFLGILSFIIVMVLFVMSFKLGGKLSVVYPVYATTFVWGALIAKFALGEQINFSKIIGIFLICAGVAVISRTSHS